MLRNGLYALYDGVLYEAGTKDDKTVILLSSEALDGFLPSPYKEGIYRKEVEKTDLASLSVIKTYCDLDGFPLEVIEDGDEGYLLFTSSCQAAKALGFTRLDRMEFKKSVKKEEVPKLYEVVTELL